MPLPSILDVAHEHLFADVDKLEAAGLPKPTISHIIRLRDVYTYWLTFPSKRDRDIVAELKARYSISDTVAREDLRLIKILLGDLQQESKNYMLYRVTEMLSRAYDKAAANNNTRDMIAAAARLGEIHKLGKDDDHSSIIDKVAPVVLAFTDDPTCIGFDRMPNFREKKKKMLEKYWLEETSNIEFEEIDARIDDIFKPQLLPANGAQDTTGIS